MISKHEQQIVEALNRGLIDDNGELSCPVCHKQQRGRQSYGPHWRRKHFASLSKAAQLEVDGMNECSTCGMIVAQMATHVRDHHASKAVARVNGKQHSAVDVVDTVDDTDVDSEPARTVTPTDAGLAILAGLRPGSTITVEQLPDVVDWLHSTEHVVGLFKR